MDSSTVGASELQFLNYGLAYTDIPPFDHIAECFLPGILTYVLREKGKGKRSWIDICCVIDIINVYVGGGCSLHRLTKGISKNKKLKIRLQ